MSPLIFGYLFDVTSSYVQAVCAAAITLIIAGALSMTLDPFAKNV
jgi:cyanate permease